MPWRPVRGAFVRPVLMCVHPVLEAGQSHPMGATVASGSPRHFPNSQGLFQGGSWPREDPVTRSDARPGRRCVPTERTGEASAQERGADLRCFPR